MDIAFHALQTAGLYAHLTAAFRRVAACETRVSASPTIRKKSTLCVMGNTCEVGPARSILTKLKKDCPPLLRGQGLLTGIQHGLLKINALPQRLRPCHVEE